MKLEGRVAIVTGAASGIGRGIVRRFCAEGARVVAVDLDEGRLAKAVGPLTAAGSTVTPVLADVADPDGVEQMFAAAAELGGLHVLCNNAGVLDGLAPVHDTPDALWERVQRINVTGPFQACRRALALFMEAGGGAIVNTTSAAGLRGGRGGAAYVTSKHALVGLTRSIAWFYGPHGIRCNAVAPGSIQTRMQASMMPHPDGMARYQPYFGQIPPFGRAADVAEVVTFLASDEARYVNGAVVPVDGGWLAY